MTPQVLGSTGAYGAVGGWEPVLDVTATWVLLLTIAVLFGWVERLGVLPWHRLLRRRPMPAVPPPVAAPAYVFEGNVVHDEAVADGR